MQVLKPEILAALAAHGVHPEPDTPVEMLRDQVRDLYLVEIRDLRDRCRAGQFPVTELAGRVVELRRRYPVLSIPIEHWLAAPT